MKMYIYSKKGFTLIELMVVIAIVGILASVVVGTITSVKTKGNDVKRMSEITDMQKALEGYYSENGTYPVTSWVCSYQNSWETGVLGTALEDSFPTMPVDPTNESLASYTGGSSYCYYSNGYGRSGGWYMLVYKLENRNVDLDERMSSVACDDTTFSYGGSSDGYLITTGGSCVN